jgi:hypothetical protein
LHPYINLQKKTLYLAFLDISKAFDRDFSSMFAKSVIKIEKSVGDKTQPCFDPNSWSNQSDSKSPNITLFSTNTDDKQYLK